MSQVLYRKYRSKSFSELIGQEQIVKVLQSAIHAGKPAHAYLFSGPRGTGKTSTARIFAREVNGLPEGELIEHNMDIVEIDAASNRGINEIRELKEKVAFAPAQLKYKVYIIDEVHMLTREAFNAILKTLEEPPATTIFILATTEVHKVPATILSRVVRFDFQLATNEQLLSKLKKILLNEKVTIEDQGLERIVNLARGSFRDAESITEKVINVAGEKSNASISAEQVFSILGVTSESELRKILEKILDPAINQAKLAEISDHLDGLFKTGINPQQFLYDMSQYLLNIITMHSSVQKTYTPSEMKMVYKLVGIIQQLLTNYNHYLDPYLMIKISILGSLELVADTKLKAESHMNDEKKHNKEVTKVDQKIDKFDPGKPDNELFTKFVSALREKDLDLYFL